MKINEVEEILEVTRANIRFYEKEGLLAPSRAENGYRDYSEADVERLKQIIIFRKIGISIADIKGLLDGELSLQNVINRNMNDLKKQMEELNGALEICAAMQREKLKMSDLDTAYYWKFIHEEEEKGARFMEVVKDILDYEAEMLGKTELFSFARGEGCKGLLGIVLFVALISVFLGFYKQHTGETQNFLQGFLPPLIVLAGVMLILFIVYWIRRREK